MRVSQGFWKGKFSKNGSRSLVYTKVNLKIKNDVFYSVLKEWPQEQDFVTFGLLILNPDPIKLSI